MDTLWNDVNRSAIFYGIPLMGVRYMEKLEKKLNKFEEDIFEGKDIDIKRVL